MVLSNATTLRGYLIGARSCRITHESIARVAIRANISRETPTRVEIMRMGKSGVPNALSHFCEEKFEAVTCL